MKQLSPAALLPLRAKLRTLIADQVQAIVGCGTFDGVEIVARYLQVRVISELVGLPEESQAKMLR